MHSIHDGIRNFTPGRISGQLGLALALALAVALALHVDPHWYWPGLFISAAGLLMQLWVFGSIRSRRLVPVNGPYGFVRNPQYIAGFVFLFGLVLMAGTPWLLVTFSIAYLVLTAYRVGKEEELLAEKFGAPYRRYCRAVPRFVPRLKPYEEGSLWFFSIKHFQRQYGEVLIVLAALLYLACYAIAFRWR